MRSKLTGHFYAPWPAEKMEANFRCFAARLARRENLFLKVEDDDLNYDQDALNRTPFKKTLHHRD